MSDWERFKSLSLRGVVGRSKLDQAEQKYLASRTRMQEIENRIALIGPGSDQLQAEKELAGIRLEEALLDLDRTKIKAPFEGIFNSGGRTRQWEGSLVRIKAEVDEKTRTLPVIVEVPYEGSGGQAGSIGILRPGMFVTVEIEGKRIDSAYLLPRSAIHPGDIVYIAEKNRLAIRKVEVLRRLNDSIYAGKGLKQGDMVIITPISSPKEGMELRVRPEETKGQR
jgi:multidrug efflux pump subunit AcrA (membrane-fusion protein)